MTGIKTVKFGGTSLADAKQIRKAASIIQSDPTRRCVVVSAPGKRYPGDAKVTDVLYALARASKKTRRELCAAIISRYQSIIDCIGLKIDFSQWLQEALEEGDKMGRSDKKNYIASRGEYWMAKIIAEILGYEFISADSFIVFDNGGLFDLLQTEKLAKSIRLKKIATKRGIVIPGFYGAMPDGKIKTFSRGGSDITGAIVAACVKAEIYENWTDVPGVLMADPRIVKNPRRIKELTYHELRELAFMGADVLHEEAVFPVRKRSIPINVRDTNHPRNPGTMIVSQSSRQARVIGSIIGIAGRRGFSVIRIEKTLMDSEVGFLRRVCQVMEKHCVSIEDIPGGIDVLSVIVRSSEFDPISRVALRELKKDCAPEAISVEKNMALICVVGSAMAAAPGVAARIFKAIASVSVNVRMISQGSSEINIVIGVDEKDYEISTRAIYREFEK